MAERDVGIISGINGQMHQKRLIGMRKQNRSLPIVTDSQDSFEDQMRMINNQTKLNKRKETENDDEKFMKEESKNPFFDQDQSFEEFQEEEETQQGFQPIDSNCRAINFTQNTELSFKQRIRNIEDKIKEEMVTEFEIEGEEITQKLIDNINKRYFSDDKIFNNKELYDWDSTFVVTQGSLSELKAMARLEQRTVHN